MNLEKAQQEFLLYTNAYKNLNRMCELKINHTFRVMNLCKEIAESLNLSKEDIELAMCCGLLHDIGRFEQWRLYETFNDLSSKDHAQIGVSVLKKKNYLSKYVSDISLKEIILNSIYYHNKYKISKKLSEREQLFCNIVRDADKIDILYLCSINQIKYDIQNNCFNEKVMKDLKDGKLIRKKSKATNADLLAIPLGFIYDINYPKSFKILKEKNYINQLIDYYEEKSTNNELKLQLQEIKKKTNQFIKEKITC